MSEPVNTPAFPITPEIWGTHPDFHGMTQRDWFAGQVVEQCIRNSLNHDGTWSPDNVAYHAYLVADAMLAERAKPRP